MSLVAPIASLLKLSFKILENSRLEFSCQIQLQVDILFMDYPISGQNFSHKDSLFEFLDQSFVRKFKLRVHKVLPYRISRAFSSQRRCEVLYSSTVS